MSLAKQLIGEPAPKPAVSETAAIEERPVHAMDLIDALAEAEFAPSSDAKHAMKDDGPEHHGTTGAGKSSSEAGKAFNKKKQKGTGGGYEASGKTTPGQVAPAPGTVKYGK